MKDTYCPKCRTHLILKDDIELNKYIKCPSCSNSFKNPHHGKKKNIKDSNRTTSANPDQNNRNQKSFFPIFLVLTITITILALSNTSFFESHESNEATNNIEQEHQEPYVENQENLAEITDEFIILYNELMGFRDLGDFHYYGFNVGYKYKEWQRRVQKLRRSPYAKDFYWEYGFRVGHLEMLGLEYALYDGRETSDAKYYQKIIRKGLIQFTTSEPEQTNDKNKQYEIYSSSNKIRMRYKNGVYHIPTYINGVPLEFIFDTGASSISISLREVEALKKQGKFSDNDIIGESTFSDATGRISVGTTIILRQVQVGNKVLYDVEASVVHNFKAPLLLGQSALARFGKISIDYNTNEITFE
jgi:aspartyl protease family protein